MLSDVTITNEQINGLPLLIGIMEEMGIRELIDQHVTPHGHWQGTSVGTTLTIWLSHLLLERDHRLVMVRDWAADRAQTINALLDITLRDTDCTDDRLATILTMLGTTDIQTTLDKAFLQRWIRVYHLPTETIRLDSTSISVYHDAVDPDGLLQFGHSKDHRPDLRQFKAMLASLDPLGLPIACQPVAGQRADDGLYVPAYTEAVKALGTAAVLVVGDSKMGALATRGQIVAGGSCYLCAYRPPSATDEIAGWIEEALTRTEHWQTLDVLDETTGELVPVAVLDVWTREQNWVDTATQQGTSWTERVLVVRSQQQQDGLRRRREEALMRVTARLEALRQPPKQGRKRYRTAAELTGVVDEVIAAAGLTGVVQADVREAIVPNGTAAWTVGCIWVDVAAWQALIARLGWHLYVSNTTEAQYSAATLVGTYRQQAVQERGFARLKTRNLQIRPVYLRDEQRIVGLLWLLVLALRVLVLTEQRLRARLEEREEGITGLNPASRTQATVRPTTERVFAAFGNITLTTIDGPGLTHRHVSPLNRTQQHILDLLDLPTDLYDRLAESEPNSVLHLRE